MSRKLMLAGAVVAGALLAFVATPRSAVAQSNVVLVDETPRLMRGGFYSGTGASSSANRVTGVYEASATIDFASATTTCADSSAITVTGAQVGDPCFVGIDSATVNAANSNFTCYALANQVKVRHCAAGTASDPTSATFRVRVISSR